MTIRKRLVKNTLINLTGYFYLLVASFISIPILLNYLGKDIFGIYLLLATVVPLTSIFDFGLSQAVIRRLSLPSTSEKKKKIIWQTSLFLYLITSLFLFLITLTTLSIFSQKMTIFSLINKITLRNTIIILAATASVNLLNNHLLTLPQALQRFDIYNVKTLLVGSGNTIVSALMAIISPNLTRIFLIQLVFHLLTTLALILFAFKKNYQLIPDLKLKVAKSLFAFGIKHFTGITAVQLRVHFSKYILGVLLSASAITAFAIPQSLVIKITGVIQQLALAFYPMSASLLKKEGIYKLKKIVYNSQTLFITIGIFQIIAVHQLGFQFLRWWLKDPVLIYPAFSVWKILSFYFALTILAPIPTALLESLNYPHIPTIFSVISSIINISLVLYLTPKYQILGPAYAMLISAVITVPLLLLVSHRIFNKEMERL